MEDSGECAGGSKPVGRGRREKVSKYAIEASRHQRACFF
jgi:hypothetical protein